MFVIYFLYVIKKTLRLTQQQNFTFGGVNTPPPQIRRRWGVCTNFLSFHNALGHGLITYIETKAKLNKKPT
jgi:hypothetical protein